LALVGVGMMAVFFAGTDRTSPAAAATSQTTVMQGSGSVPAPEGTAKGAAPGTEATGTTLPDAEGTVEDDHSVEVPAIVMDLDLSGVLTIASVLDHAEHLVGKEVIVRGTILTQCIVGCRFAISDDTGVINVELEDDALENTLAQGSVGKTVEVRGTITEGAPPKLIVHDPAAWDYAQ
jgi:uncharacterized protein YdeI (BOF family)